MINERVDRVTEFIERLEQFENLVGTTEPVMPHSPDKGIGRAEVKSISEEAHLSRRLSEVHDFLVKIKKVVLEEKDIDMCSLERREELLNSIDNNNVSL